MPSEYEARILGIDPAATHERIIGAGGTQHSPPQLVRRYVYDLTPAHPGRWIRLRQIGDQPPTLTVKHTHHDGIDGTHEWETVVSDLDDTHALLEAAGHHAKGYQENRRTSYLLGGARLEIDHWPHVAPYLEIEADSEGQVHAAARALGYDFADLTAANTTKLYAAAGIDIDTVPDLRFPD
jgi:adenylate cyclase class 2